MAEDQLKIQTTLLEQLKTDLLLIVTEYSNADQFSGEIADAVGNDQLGDRVREFSSKWNDRRENMTEQVQALHDAVAAIQETLDEVDRELTKALEEGASDTAANAPEAVPQAV